MVDHQTEHDKLKLALLAIIYRAYQRTGATVSDDVVEIATKALGYETCDEAFCVSVTAVGSL